MGRLFKNRAVIGVICLVLASLIAFVAIPIINHLTVQTTHVVKVVTDVSMGTQITREMVEEVEVGKLNLPDDVANEIGQIIGDTPLYITSDLKAGDMVRACKLTKTLVLPANKIRQMERNEFTYTIDIDRSYKSRLLPNDIVTFTTYDEDSGTISTVPELRYVSVVTTTTSDGIDILSENQVAPDGKQLKAETITFILNDTQLRVLQQLQQSKNFMMALKCRGDEANMSMVREYLNQQKQYFTSLPKVEETDGTEEG
jgi:pilus assembly protein CpaB